MINNALMMPGPGGASAEVRRRMGVIIGDHGVCLPDLCSYSLLERDPVAPSPSFIAVLSPHPPSLSSIPVLHLCPSSLSFIPILHPPPPSPSSILLNSTTEGRPQKHPGLGGGSRRRMRMCQIPNPTEKLPLPRAGTRAGPRSCLRSLFPLAPSPSWQCRHNCGEQSLRTLFEMIFLL